MNYDPVLKASEHYTAGGKEISKQNLDIQKKIKKADQLIFIYPVWWYSPPAILKGFLDRILTSPFAYKYTKGIPRGQLKDKRAIVFCTTGGPTWYYWFSGNLPKRSIKTILSFCGIKPGLCSLARQASLQRIKRGKLKQESRECFDSLTKNFKFQLYLVHSNEELRLLQKQGSGKRAMQ